MEMLEMNARCGYNEDLEQIPKAQFISTTKVYTIYENCAQNIERCESSRKRCFSRNYTECHIELFDLHLQKM